MKVKIKDGQKMDEEVKTLKSNVWPNVQEMDDLHNFTDFLLILKIWLAQAEPIKLQPWTFLQLFCTR